LPPDNDVASRIDAMDLKDRLRNIETDGRDRFHAPLPVNRDRPSGDHFTGTYVLVGEPSTASLAEVTGYSGSPAGAGRSSIVRCRPAGGSLSDEGIGDEQARVQLRSWAG
jgi:hypothetical protein